MSSRRHYYLPGLVLAVAAAILLVIGNSGPRNPGIPRNGRIRTPAVQYRARVLFKDKPAEDVLVNAEQVRLDRNKNRIISQFCLNPVSRLKTDSNGLLESELEDRSGPEFSGEIEITAYHPDLGTGHLRATKESLSAAYRSGGALDIALERGNVISGRILNEKREPIPGLFVYLSTSCVAEDGLVCLQGLWGMTDSHGQFVISGVRFNNQVGSITYQDWAPFYGDSKGSTNKIKSLVWIDRFRDPATGDWILGDLEPSAGIDLRK